ncbi:MAG: hypothetical protein ACYDH4_09940 [Candidatus Cryosericum sp.]
MSTKSFFSPPSLLYPIGGAAVGYLVSNQSLWGAGLGAIAGALLNVATVALQMETMIASGQGIQLNDNSLSVAARGVIGQGAATPVQTYIDQQTALAQGGTPSAVVPPGH